VSGCVLDTDVVIAALDRRDSHHSKAARAISTMVAEDVPLLLSLINYAETLVRPAEDERTLRIALDALSQLGVRLIAPTREVAILAARHRALSISLADGFALATAQTHDAQVASFDRRVRRVLPRLGVALAPQFA
jgi:predicted nucleic acid-binding protein